MTQIIEAIFSDGVLRPVSPLQLRDQERVRVIIAPINGHSVSNREAALKRLRAGIERMNFRSDGAYPQRDELHDRV